MWSLIKNNFFTWIYDILTNCTCCLRGITASYKDAWGQLRNRQPIMMFISIYSATNVTYGS